MMLPLLVYLIVGLGAIGAFIGASFIVTLNKMFTDEMRARLDDTPALLIELALRLLPPEQRDFYRVDWLDNLLVAFYEQNARYPLMRLLRSVPFVLPLFLAAPRIRRNTRLIREQALEDERQERIIVIGRSALRVTGTLTATAAPCQISMGGEVSPPDEPKP